MKIGLELIRRLKPATFRYKPEKDPDGRKHIGFIAQDVAELLPPEEFVIVKQDDQGYYTVDHGQFIGSLVKAVQELDEELQKLKGEKNVLSPHP